MSQPNSQKSDKKKKRARTSKEGAVTAQQKEENLDINGGATKSSLDERRFQPGEGFRASDATCTMDVGTSGVELCLIQLPLTWDMGSEGTLQLPTAASGGLGRCTDGNGLAYHVIEERSSSSRVFAFAPGQQDSPVAIQRRFTLIKQKNLDLEDFAVANKAAAGSRAKQKQENPGKESKKKKKRDSSTEDATPATAPDIQVKAKKKKKDKKVRKEGKMID